MGPRALAAALATEGAPPPTPRRPGLRPAWSPAAIREILRRPLYRGEIVWNELRKTDRGGRTRVRVRRPEAEWVRVDVPALRIVDDATWGAVQTRRRTMAA